MSKVHEKYIDQYNIARTINFVDRFKSDINKILIVNSLHIGW
jgi:hypothetical protein